MHANEFNKITDLYSSDDIDGSTVSLAAKIFLHLNYVDLKK